MTDDRGTARVEPRLSGVEETLLLPLWARSAETQRPDAIIEDPTAVSLLREIDYDFERFAHDWKSQLAIAVRTRLIDDAVGRFIHRHPAALVVNLGAGLDSRFFRLDNGELCWYDLDLPNVVAIKRRFFNESRRYRFLESSVLDFGWMEAVETRGRPVMIIAEGLLMYFARYQVRSLLRRLADAFPGAEMLIEVLAFGAVGMTRYHDTLRRFRASLKWSLADSRELEQWHPAIRLLNEWCVLDYHRERWGWLGLVSENPWFRLLYGERILHLRFEKGEHR